MFGADRRMGLAWPALVAAWRAGGGGGGVVSFVDIVGFVFAVMCTEDGFDDGGCERIGQLMDGQPAIVINS